MTSINLRRAISTVALLTVLFTTACSSYANSSSQPHLGLSGASAVVLTGSSSSHSPSSITINNLAFSGPVSVAAGATVKVVNNDSTTHTVTADSGRAFDVTIQPGGTATFTAPSKAGPYPFHCKIHSTMHGALTVTG